MLPYRSLAAIMKPYSFLLHLRSLASLHRGLPMVYRVLYWCVPMSCTFVLYGYIPISSSALMVSLVMGISTFSDEPFRGLIFLADSSACSTQDFDLSW